MNLGQDLGRQSTSSTSSSSTSSSALLSGILGALYHSDWDFAPLTPGAVIASVPNVGSCTAPLVQLTGTRRPSAAVWGTGLSAARLDGVDDSLMAVFAGADIIAANARPYCWIVVRGLPAGSSRYIASLQNSDSLQGNQLTTTNAGGSSPDRISLNRGAMGGSNQAFIVYEPPLGTSMHLIEFGCTVEGGSPLACTSLVLDGVASTTVGGGGTVFDYVATAPLTHAVVGGIFNSGAPFNPAAVDVGQYIVAPSQPSADQLLAVRSVLKTKWGTL